MIATPFPAAEVAPVKAPARPASGRLIALDVFRGLTIALMITVNNPGSWSHIFTPLEHANWNGCTPTDWVFPFFLFTVGVSSWFSLKKYQNRPPADVYRKIWRRGATIFLIGLALNTFLISAPDYSHLRILGVLQRIGIAYAIGATLCVWLPKRTLSVTGAIILLAYWLIVWKFSDPVYPYAHEVGPDKIESLSNNVVTKIDRAVLGENHLWKGKGMPFDPEGLLSDFPAVVSVILGFFVGFLVDSNPDRRKLVRKMAVWGLIGLSTGWLWGLAFPINKSLWTSSFVLYTAGIATILNALLILIIDVFQSRWWIKPALVFGMNSIMAFVLSGLWVKVLSRVKLTDAAGVKSSVLQRFYQDVVMPIGGGDNEFSSLLYALIHVAIFWLILWVFYKRGIFLKV